MKPNYTLDPLSQVFMQGLKNPETARRLLNTALGKTEKEDCPPLLLEALKADVGLPDWLLQCSAAFTTGFSTYIMLGLVPGTPYELIDDMLEQLHAAALEEESIFHRIFREEWKTEKLTHNPEVMDRIPYPETIFAPLWLADRDPTEEDKRIISRVQMRRCPKGFPVPLRDSDLAEMDDETILSFGKHLGPALLRMKNERQKQMDGDYDLNRDLEKSNAIDSGR